MKSDKSFVSYKPRKQNGNSKMNKRGMLGNVIAGFMVLSIGFVLFPMIVEEIEVACSEQLNVSSAGNTLLCSADGGAGGLVILFFVLGIAMVAIGIAAQGLRSSGLIGGYSKEEEDEDEEEDEKPTPTTTSNSKTKKTSLGSKQRRKNL